MYEIQVNKYLLFKTFLVLFLPIVFFKSELFIIFNEALYNESSNYIALIPFMILYIIYIKRYAFLHSSYYYENDKLITTKDFLGFSLILSSIIIKINLFDSFNQLEYSLLLLPVFIIGEILILFNFNILRLLFFPILMLFFLIPPPVNLVNICGNNLSRISSIISYRILSIIFNNVHLSNNYGSPSLDIISNSNEHIIFVLDIACSGIYSLISASLFIIYLLYTLKGPLIKKMFLAIIGIPVIYLLNVLRIVMIVIIGYYFGSGISLKLFHTFGGIVMIMIGTIILLLISEKILLLRFNNIVDIEYELKNVLDGYDIYSGKIVNSKLNSIKLSRVLIIIILVFLSSTPYLMQFPEYVSSTKLSDVNIREDISDFDISVLLPDLDNYTLNFIYRDLLFQNISNQEASLMFLYEHINGTEDNIWAAISVADTIGDLHAWDVCMIPTIRNGYGVQYDLRDVPLSEDPPIIARYFAFSSSNPDNIQVTLFWFTRGVFDIYGDNSKKWVMLSLISLTNDSLEVFDLENYLLPKAKEVAQHWYPLSYMSDRIIIIKQMIPFFRVTIGVIFSFVIMFNIYKQYNKKRIANIAFSKLNDYVDIKILEFMKEMKGNVISDKKIAEYYDKKEGVNNDLHIIHRKLLAAENLGIIERKIVYKDNSAFYSWHRI